MMGHVGLVNLDRNYFKVHILELAEECLNAVPKLTIDYSEQLRQSSILKDEKIHRLESEKDARILDLEKMVAALADRIDMQAC